MILNQPTWESEGQWWWMPHHGDDVTITTVLFAHQKPDDEQRERLLAWMTVHGIDLKTVSGSGPVTVERKNGKAYIRYWEHQVGENGRYLFDEINNRLLRTERMVPLVSELPDNPLRDRA